MKPKQMTSRDPSSQEGRRYGGCLVMLGIVLILGGLFYGILWGLQGAYLGEMSPQKSPAQKRPSTPSLSPSIGAEP
jgi:hypothetical protein